MMTTKLTFAQLALFFATFFYKSQVTVGIGARAPIIASFIHAIWKEHQNPFYLKLVVKPGVVCMASDLRNNLSNYLRLDEDS